MDGVFLRLFDLLLLFLLLNLNSLGYSLINIKRLNLHKRNNKVDAKLVINEL